MVASIYKDKLGFGRNKIRDSRMKIDYYKEAIKTTFCPVLRLKLEKALAKEILYSLRLYEELYEDLKIGDFKGISRQTREFTLKDLEAFDGSNGRLAYVAVDGIVYDVSMESTWGGASHFGLLAGRDLTSQFTACHRDRAILSKLTVVGVIVKGGMIDADKGMSFE